MPENCCKEVETAWRRAKAILCRANFPPTNTEDALGEATIRFLKNGDDDRWGITVFFNLLIRETFTVYTYRF